MRSALPLALLLGAAACGKGGAADARLGSTGNGCDSVAQDCPDGGTPKCSVLFVDGVAAAVCLPLEGAVALGQPCARSEGVGRDDCAPGGYCSGVAFPVVAGEPRTRVCRPFCRDGGDCAGGEACIKVTDAVPPDGLCVPAGCALFDDSCASGMRCDALELTPGSRWTGVCRSPGSAAVGEACTEVDCVANAHCQPGSPATCRRLCDDAHPCPAGSCAPYAGLAGGGGLCPP